VASFGPSLRGLHLAARCDNTFTVAAATKLASRSPLANSILRLYHRALAQWDVSISPLHVAGAANTLADPLSRNNLPLFLSLVPQEMTETSLQLVTVPPLIRLWR
jgi:hypothetical protein